MMYPKITWRHSIGFCVCATLLTVAVPCALAQRQLEGGSGLTPEQEIELDYADRLLASGLPDYARMVLDRLDLPASIMDIRRVQSLTAQNKFEEAEALVASRTGDTQEVWALRLALADGYYAWGRYDRASQLYNSFFERFPQGPEEALKPFFITSAYQYAQMMILTGDLSAAADAYRMALRAEPERHIARQMMSELAELLIRMAETVTGAEREALLTEVQPILDEILWVQDLWFGRAIGNLAHVRMLQGDVQGATDLIDDYGEELRGIDAALREQSEETGEDLTRLSPMAQCRYMVGLIMHNEALRMLEDGEDRQKAFELLIGTGPGTSGALQHFLNVFVRYPNTAWAPDAGNRFRQVEALLEQEWDRRVRARITPEQWKAVEIAQFREARSLFNQQRFEEAADNYEQVLALFPERDTSVQALGELAACYIELEMFTFADAVVRHLAERFNQHQDHMSAAGDQVIRVAFKYLEMNQPQKHHETYDVFFEFFDRHPRTVLELVRFGEEAFREENYERALEFYTNIVENHENSNSFLDALNRIATIHSRMGNQQQELRTLNTLIRTLEERGQKNHLLISAKYRFATALRGMGPRFVDRAVALYRELEEILKDPAQRSQYQQTPQEQEANLQMLQGSMLFGAISDAMRAEVPERVQEAFNRRAGGREVPPETILNNFYKAGAIRRLLELVDMFPESSFAPAALSQAGTLNTVIGRADDARQVLQRLQRNYPDSVEAANAVFMIGRNLLDMGMRREAVAYFKQMFAGEGDYGSNQILTAARELFDAGEYQIAIEAFDRIIANETERRFLEPARVGKGRALVRLNRYEDALPILEKVLEDYPNSGFTIQVCRDASMAYAAVASRTSDDARRFELFNKAVDALNRARRFAQDDATRTELDIVVAQMFERRAEAERQFGTTARAEEFRNDAVAAYQAVIMFRDHNDPLLAPYIQDAYAFCLPLMLEMERWDDVVEDAQRYLDTFPDGKHVLSVRQAFNRGRAGGGTIRGEEDAIVAEDDDDLLL